MREIKFRAWDRKHSIFFKGTHEAYKGKLEDMLISMNGYPMLRGDPKYNDTTCLRGELYNNENRFILMQFTGLKDKNGKEIYERDILKLDGGGEPCIGSVGFERGCFTFEAPWLNKEKQYMPELYRYTFFSQLEKGKLFKDCVVVEIIGNIYENEDLLK